MAAKSKERQLPPWPEGAPEGTPRGRSSGRYYRIEVRDRLFSERVPLQLHDGIVGPNWRELTFEIGTNPAGIPLDIFEHGTQHRLLSYEAAVAFAWTAVAQNRYGLECRVVAYRLETAYTLQREG